MPAFLAKKIQKETLGDILKKRREELMFEIEEVATKINIAPKYIQYLEKGEYEKLPGKGYGRTFLKAYAELIGLYPREILEIFSAGILGASWRCPQGVFQCLIDDPSFVLALI